MRILCKFFFAAPAAVRPSRPLLRPRCNFSTSRSRRRTPSRKSPHPPNKQSPAKPRVAGAPSLLRKITEIVGVDPSEPPVPRAAQLEDSAGADSRSRDVRQIARESACPRNGRVGVGVETTSHADETQEAYVEEVDVSPMVQKITEIVRSDSSGNGMEERLGGSVLVVDPDVVEKVLKRCFKVGHLAHRFFRWAKLRPGFCHTTGTYNVMIYIAGEARDFDLVEDLVRDMEKDSCQKSIKTWTIIVSQYGKGRQIGKALKAFQDMRKSGCQPDGKIFETIIQALCKSREVEVAMEFYKDMLIRNIAPSMALYETLMCYVSGSGDATGVRLLRDEMMKTVSESEAYSCILRSLCKSGRIDEAQDLFNEMKRKDITFCSDDLRILLKALCLAGRVSEALEVMNSMKKQKLSINSEDYGLVIYGNLRNGDTSKALEVLYDMKRLGCLPTATTCSQAIHHLLKSADFDKAYSLYSEMLENDMVPHIMTTRAMLIGLVRNDKVPEAREIFEKMNKECKKSVQEVYSLFIKELCNASKATEAFKILTEMLEPCEDADDKTFRLVISSLSRKGEMDKAKLIQQMYNPVISNSPEGDTLDTHANCGVVHEASETLNSSDQEEISPIKVQIGYNKEELKYICGILSSSKEWSSILEDLEKSTISFTPELVDGILHRCWRHGHKALLFFKWVENLVGYNHNTNTYNMAIKISGSAKDFKHMRNLYFEMRRRRCPITSDTWTIMISQYGQAGLTEMALKKFREMKSEGYLPNASTYKFLIIYLCGRKGRKADEAITIFQEMISSGYLPDKEMAETYLSCLCESNKLLEARQSAELLCRKGFTLQVSKGLLVRSLCRTARLKEALTLTEEMERLGCSVNHYIYGSLIHGLLRAGQLDEAMGKMAAMRSAGISHTVHVYTSLIVHHFKEKQTEKAIEIFKRMVKDGCKPTVVTYSALIRGYVSAGMISDAWDIFDKMRTEGPDPDFKTYSLFISCLCKVGRSEEGLLLLHEMLKNDILPSAVNFRTVFYGLNSEGKQDLARSVLHTKWDLSRKRKFLIFA